VSRAICIVWAACALFAHHLQADELEPFASDGCSAFPDGTPSQQQLWLQCCTAHDKSYWRGGTAAERESADLALQTCVADLGEPALAALMLTGVRAGGSPYLPTRFRWGYGWSYPRPYGPLTADELEQVLRFSEAPDAQP
jgi:hypothetical protein